MDGTSEQTERCARFRVSSLVILAGVLLGLGLCAMTWKYCRVHPGIRGSDRAASPRAVEVVDIDARGAVRVNDELVGSAQDRDLLGLRDKLKEQAARSGEKVPVVIIPKPSTSHARVLDVLNVCSVSGIRNVYLTAGDGRFRWRFKLGSYPPQESVKENSPKVEELIAIDVDGSVSVNQELVGSGPDRELRGLRAKLREQADLFGGNVPVIIVPHPDVRLGRVFEVLNVCSACGITNVSFEGH